MENTMLRIAERCFAMILKVHQNALFTLNQCAAEIQPPDPILSSANRDRLLTEIFVALINKIGTYGRPI